MKKYRKHIILLIAILILIFFGPGLFGYSYTEKAALEKSYPNQEGEIVHENKLNEMYKLIIWDSASMKHVKLLKQKWGFLHRVDDIAQISSRYGEEKMKRTWSASLVDDKKYRTIFGVEVMDHHIVKVIVTNEGYNEHPVSLEEAKIQSTVYLDMSVRNGYASELLYLPPQDAGQFVFRGINAKGEVIVVN